MSIYSNCNCNYIRVSKMWNWLECMRTCKKARRDLLWSSWKVFLVAFDSSKKQFVHHGDEPGQHATTPHFSDSSNATPYNRAEENVLMKLNFHRESKEMIWTKSWPNWLQIIKKLQKTARQQGCMSSTLTVHYFKLYTSFSCRHGINER